VPRLARNNRTRGAGCGASPPWLIGLKMLNGIGRPLPNRPHHKAAAQHEELCNAEVAMRDPEIIETELMEISAIADDTLKFERIVIWCASHPDEVPFALHQFMRRPNKHPSQTSKT
jgi:hypothetical protein